MWYSSFWTKGPKNHINLKSWGVPCHNTSFGVLRSRNGADLKSWQSWPRRRSSSPPLYCARCFKHVAIKTKCTLYHLWKIAWQLVIHSVMPPMTSCYCKSTSWVCSALLTPTDTVPRRCSSSLQTPALTQQRLHFGMLGQQRLHEFRLKYGQNTKSRKLRNIICIKRV